MSIDDEEYLKILKKPIEYMNCIPELVKYTYGTLNPRLFPVGSLNGVRVYFNHYASYKEALELWKERVKRINWENLFVMMYTENRETAEKFLELSYDRKICFVPFETEERSLFYIDYSEHEIERNVPFSVIVNGMAKGMYQYYDVLNLLLGIKNKDRVKSAKD